MVFLEKESSSVPWKMVYFKGSQAFCLSYPLPVNNVKVFAPGMRICVLIS